MPGNAHALVGARTFPELGIARRAVQGEAVVLREQDLRFTDDEVAEFARARGVPVARLAPACGWPALAELLARVTGVTVGEYVWEQVLGPVARRADGAGSSSSPRSVAPTTRWHRRGGTPVHLEALLADVPLVSRTSPDGGSCTVW